MVVPQIKCVGIVAIRYVSGVSVLIVIDGNKRIRKMLVAWIETIMTVSTSINVDKEIVPFVDNSTNTKLKKKAFRIGQYLLVSYVGTKENTFQIFKAINGKPLFSAVFINKHDAIEFAEFIDKAYQDYLLLLEDYPDANIFALAKWSVKNGIKIYEIIKELSNINHPIKQNDLYLAINEASQNVSK